MTNRQRVLRQAAGAGVRRIVNEVSGVYASSQCVEIDCRRVVCVNRGTVCDYLDESERYVVTRRE